MVVFLAHSCLAPFQSRSMDKAVYTQKICDVRAARGRLQEQLVGRILHARVEKIGHDKEKFSCYLVDDNMPQSVLLVEAWGQVDRAHACKELLNRNGQAVSVTNCKITSKGKTLAFHGKAVKVTFDASAKVVQVKDAQAAGVPQALPLISISDIGLLASACSVSVKGVIHCAGAAVEREISGSQSAKQKKHVANVKLACDSKMIDCAFWGELAHTVGGLTEGQAVRLDLMLVKPEAGGLFKLVSTEHTVVTPVQGAEAQQMSQDLSKQLDSMSPEYGVSRQQKLSQASAQVSLVVLRHMSGGGGSVSFSGMVKIPAVYVVDVRGLSALEPESVTYTGCRKCKRVVDEVSCPLHPDAGLAKLAGAAITLADPSATMEAYMYQESLLTLGKLLNLVGDDAEWRGPVNDLLQAAGVRPFVARAAVGPRVKKEGHWMDLLDLEFGVNKDGALGAYHSDSIGLPSGGDGVPSACCKTVAADALGQLTIKGKSGSRVIGQAIVLGLAAAEPEVTVLPGIDGMSVRLQATCQVCDGSMVLLQEGVPLTVKFLSRLRAGEPVKAAVTAGKGCLVVHRASSVEHFSETRFLFRHEAMEFIKVVDRKRVQWKRKCNHCLE